MAKKSPASADASEEERYGLPKLGLRGTLSDKLIENLRKQGKLRVAQPGEILFTRGSEPSEVFVIIRGTVTTSGVMISVGELSAPEIAGVESMVLGTRHAYTARAATECEVYPLTAESLMTVLQSKSTGGWILTFEVRRRLAVEEELQDRTQKVTNFRERVEELSRRLKAKTEEITTDLRPSLERAQQESGSLSTENEQLKERNDGQAAGLAKLNDIVRDQEVELAGLRSDVADGARKLVAINEELSKVNEALVQTEQLRHLADRTMREQVQRAENAEADLAKVQTALADEKKRAHGLAEKLGTAKIDSEDAHRQLGDEQRAKVAALTALYELEQAVDARVAAAHDAQAALYADYCKRQDEVIKALRLRNNELRDERNQLRGTRAGTHNMSRQDINLNEIMSGLAELKAKMFPSVIPPPLDATAPDAVSLPATQDPPSDTQPNRAIGEVENHEQALTLDLDTFVGKPPTKPKNEAAPAASQTQRFDEPTGRIGLDDIEIVVGSIPPPKPE